MSVKNLKVDLWFEITRLFALRADHTKEIKRITQLFFNRYLTFTRTICPYNTDWESLIKPPHCSRLEFIAAPCGLFEEKERNVSVSFWPSDSRIFSLQTKVIREDDSLSNEQDSQVGLADLKKTADVRANIGGTIIGASVVGQ